MGILTMFGLVTAEEHAKVETELATTKGSLSLQKSTAEQATANLVKVADERDKFKQQVRDTCSRAERAEKALAEAQAAYDNEHSDLNSARETIAGLRAALTTAEELVAGYKADAEAMRKKRQDDSDRAQAKRDAAKGAISAPKAGKPRTAIPAKVGKTASAKISGDRPAKKAVR